jgi:hypothetical protein
MKHQKNGNEITQRAAGWHPQPSFMVAFKTLLVILL